MVALYKRLGISKKDLSSEEMEEYFFENLERLKKVKYPNDIIDSLSTTASILSFDFYFLENIEYAKKYAEKIIYYTFEYFFGEWRKIKPIDKKPPNAPYRKTFEPWENLYRESIFWASCLRDWDSVKKLSEYPTDDCPIGRYETKYECKWLLTLASVIRGEPLEKLKKYTNSIDKGRSKYHKFLLEMLRAICEKRSERFNLALKVYLDYLQENVFDPPEVRKIELDGSPEEKIEKAIKLYSESIEQCKKYYGPSKPEKVAVEGTFLINFARRKGLQVEYPAEYEDRIVKLQK